MWPSICRFCASKQFLILSTRATSVFSRMLSIFCSSSTVRPFALRLAPSIYSRKTALEVKLLLRVVLLKRNDESREMLDERREVRHVMVLTPAAVVVIWVLGSGGAPVDRRKARTRVPMRHA